ncbi:MAG: GNAT family N-acetyltransferase [Acidobacteriota bacterium]|nr:GNAT family N-acetyltransferase [Acidobacteriota bacterium]
MTLYCINPLEDSRWEELVQTHEDASVFHATAWMRALHSSYGYESRVLTTSKPAEPLQNGIPFCRVTSWLTGSRIVSLPFADHCQPLVSSPGDQDSLLEGLKNEGKEKPWKYAELRPVKPMIASEIEGFHPTASYAFHTLDMGLEEEAILRSFHRNQIQQKIKKATKVGLQIEHGNSPELLGEFYRLLLITRRRHQLPPQPRIWFENLAEAFRDALVVWVARHEGKAIASILTLASNRTVVYKYGCSDPEFHNLGGMQALMWAAIQYSKARQARLFDFGRSDLGNDGLITYKNQWGTEFTTVHYYRNRVQKESQTSHGAPSGLAKKLFATMPDSCLVAAGRLLYRHMG